MDNMPSSSQSSAEEEEIPVLAGDVPVEMPELPTSLSITSVEQFKATADPTRARILGIIQLQPATAKQIAHRLKVAHGAVGHHLQVLEAAGLVHVVAKRLVHGIVAKYYARTARIFIYKLPSDVAGGVFPATELVSHGANEFAEAVVEDSTETGTDNRTLSAGFPHARLSPERVRHYQERLDAIVEDLMHEPNDPRGEVYGCLVALFRSPNYLQREPPAESATPSAMADDHNPHEKLTPGEETTGQ